MSDKTFLQELQSIYKKIEKIETAYDETYNISSQLEDVKDDVKNMLDQCLEIQLAMMKQGNMIDAKGR